MLLRMSTRLSICQRTEIQPKLRRLADHQTGSRRLVVAFRKRGGRTLSFATRWEAKGIDLAKRYVSRITITQTDKPSYWDRLHGGSEVGRINHSEAYSLDCICGNQVECYFSPLGCMVTGQRHNVSARYLHAYSDHAAWIEDHRRLSNGALAFRALGLATTHPVSRHHGGVPEVGRVTKPPSNRHRAVEHYRCPLSYGPLCKHMHVSHQQTTVRRAACI